MVRDVFGSVHEESAPAVAFVAKQEGLDALLQRIRQCLDTNVGINWDLAIQWEGLDAGTLLRMLAGPSAAAGDDAVIEIEDLLRKVFRDCQTIRVRKLLWYREERAAVVCTTFGRLNREREFIACLTTRYLVESDIEHYRRFGPPDEQSNSITFERTSHFGIALFSCGGSAESLRSLKELYRTASESTTTGTLSELFDVVLKKWDRGQRLVVEDVGLADFCRRIRKHDDRVNSAKAVERLVARWRAKLLTIGMVLGHQNDVVTIHWERQSGTFRRLPDHLFGKRGGAVTVHVPVVISPGLAVPDAIVADGEGRVWLTEFSAAGVYPPFWNCCCLEAAFRYDWRDTSDANALVLFERELVSSRFTQLSVDLMPSSLKKAIRSLQFVRRRAQSNMMEDENDYQLSLWHQSLRRLAQIDPKSMLTVFEISRVGQLVWSIYAIGNLLHDYGKQSRHTDRSLVVDFATGMVRINGAEVSIRGQGYQVLSALYRRANQLCTRRELIDEVFREQFDEGNESQVSRLNTAIRRLRQRIEEDPQNPRFLVTEPGEGYRLRVNNG
jgi:DNA-binding response OmpR family regulator